MHMAEISQSTFYRSFFSPGTPTPPSSDTGQYEGRRRIIITNSSHVSVSVALLEPTTADGQILCGLIQAFTFLVSGSIDYLSPNCFSISDLIHLMTRSSLYGSHLNTQYPLYTTFPVVCGRLLESAIVPF